MAAQVALKRQQAAEDAIALHLASAESGTTYDYLPPGRIFGMQVTSPEPDSSDNTTEPQSCQEQNQEEILNLFLKRCNHDLLKAIEHFNMNNNQKQETEPDSNSASGESVSAFKPVSNGGKVTKPYVNPHTGGLPFISSNKVIMHSLYPFLPLFNSQPVLPSPVYVPGFCECELCKHGLYSRIDPTRP
ncbi:hypothetical protein NQ314_019161 [Rhamnusium bicolor]|uniref:Uncharacterized protein n=1 Tax=Rhamnusium bicolor TaxID=1586634 RepID=A0AAV8WPB0_9CUCU|nr:hypothetical protein NQ314_019161 [Rhamnusium bicolor]